MSVYTAFFPDLGFEASQHWLGEGKWCCAPGWSGWGPTTGQGNGGLLGWPSPMGREPLGGGQQRQAHAQWSSQELHLS